jgi:uncharacterized protein (TIGR02246 family)
MTTTRSRALALLAAIAAVGGLAVYGLFQAPRPAGAAGQEEAKKAEAAPSQSARDTEEAALRKTTAAYIDALNSLDADAVMSFWGPDCDYINEAGKPTKGRDAIGARFKQGLPHKKGHKAKLQIHSIKFLRPDVALQDGTLDWVAPDASADSNRYAVVWEKSPEGKWRISSVRDLPAEVTEAPSLAYPQLKQLEWLVGEWVDDTDKVDIQVNCKWAPSKSFLLMDYLVKREGADPMTVHQRIGWDPLNGVVRSWIFDDTGGFGEGVWQREENQWTVAYAGTLPDGGTGSSTNLWKFVDDKSFIWRSTAREVDSQPLADIEVKFIRKGGAPKQ